MCHLLSAISQIYRNVYYIGFIGLSTCLAASLFVCTYGRLVMEDSRLDWSHLDRFETVFQCT